MTIFNRLVATFGRRPGRRRKASQIPRARASGGPQPAASVFARSRPWTPPAPFWCTVTAYYTSGQPIRIWSGGAHGVRLAVKVLRTRVEALVGELDLPEDSTPGLWLRSPAAEARAHDDLSASRSHAITVNHGDVVYIVAAAETVDAGAGPSARTLVAA
ncbi:hypothetical protein [Kitasatospora sp. NPDC098663]|uniref:hypothetical protein n=1 Tax=Kitasatospora sp. NPDC098663 TaxID=3364096 RepID=UPI00380DA89B